MKMLRALGKKTCAVFTITAFMSLMCMGISYGDNADKPEVSLEKSARTMSPGWLNAVFQKAYRIREPGKTRAGEGAEYIQKEFGKSLVEDAREAVRPDLKKKRGGPEDQPGMTKATVLIEQRYAVESRNYNVNIGAGANQQDEYGNVITDISNQRLVSEEINGVRHIYVGAYKGGTAGTNLDRALALAHSGDILIMRGGSDVPTYGTFEIKKSGLKLYGGYNADGVRDIDGSPTRIKATRCYRGIYVWNSTELNGLDITAGYGVDIHSSNVTVANCTLRNGKIMWMTLGYGVNIVRRNVTNNLVIGCKIYTTYGLDIDHGSYTTVADTKFNSAYMVSIQPGTVAFAGGNTWNRGYVSNMGGTFIYSENRPSRIGGGGTVIHSPDLEKPALAQEGWMEDVRQVEQPGGIIPALRRFFNPPVYKRFPTMYVNPLIAMGRGDDTSIITGRGLGRTLTDLLTVKRGDVMEGGKALKRLDSKAVAKVAKEAVGEYALSLAAGGLERPYFEAAERFSKILNDPTWTEKRMLAVTDEILYEIQKLKEVARDAQAKKGLEEAEERFTQMAATALLAQAIPDLLARDDVATIRNLFSGLDTENRKLMIEYEGWVYLYYHKVAEELASNMTSLQLRNLLPGDVRTEEDMARLPHSRIDAIIDSIREVKNKTQTEKAIMKKADTYRQDYILFAQKQLEANMKLVIGICSRKLFGVLDSAGLVRENVIDLKKED